MAKAGRSQTKSGLLGFAQVIENHLKIDVHHLPVPAEIYKSGQVSPRRKRCHDGSAMIVTGSVANLQAVTINREWFVAQPP